MARTQLSGKQIKDSSVTGADILDGSVYLVDLNQEVIDAIAGASSGTTVTQTSHGFVPTDVLRKSGGVWVKAQANLTYTLGSVMVVSVTDANTFVVSSSGRYTIASHGLTIEEYYFLSDTVAGAISNIEPSVSQPILFVEDADNVWILPYRPFTAQVGAEQHDLIWKDLVAPITMAKKTGNATPDWLEIGTTGYWGYSFDPAATNEMQVIFHLGHDYAMGTNIFPHIHWSPTNTNTGVVRWIVDIAYAKGHQQQAFPLSTPTQLIIEQAASGTIYYHMVAEAELTALTSQLEPDGMLIVKFRRDGAHANDTYTGGAICLQVDIHYQADRVGTINKSPDFYT